MSSIKSAERVLAILEYFQKAKRSASVGEIADALSLPQSSTSMLVKCLIARGYLEYGDKARLLRPTYRVALLGNWIQKSLFEGGPLTDTMEAIQREVGETVTLGRQNGPWMQYVHIVDASYAVRLTIDIGVLRPMTCSALGQILLAYKSEADARAIIRRNNADAVGEAFRVNEASMMIELKEIRRRAFAESLGRMTPGASTIAMLVPIDRNAAPLAIGVGGPLERIQQRREEILSAMRYHLKLS